MIDFLLRAWPLLACFFAGCFFASAIFGWSLHSHRIESVTNQDLDAQSTLRRAFGFGLRQLGFFLLLGSASFLVSGFIFFARLKPASTLASVGASTPAPSTAIPSSANSSAPLGTSRLTGIALPAGVQSVSDASILSSSAQQLQRLVTQIDAQSQLGQSEVVMWRAPNARTQASALMMQTRSTLKASGWLYKETNAEKGVHEFVAVNTKAKKIVPGFWLVSDNF